MPRLRGFPEPIDADPPPPHSRSGYLVWLAGRQWTSILAGTFYDAVWLSGLALIPWAVGNAIDHGVIPGDVPALLLWVGIVLWLQLQHALIQGVRDRGGIINWTRSAFRSLHWIGRSVATAGPALSRRIAAGEVTATAAGDAFGVGHLSYMIGALTASVLSYAVVGVLLLTTSVPLGLLVLIGVPVFSGIFFLLVRPLRARQTTQREATGQMTMLAADTVSGLRVLRGIGGESLFLDRYRQRSQATRHAGVAVAWPVAWVQGLQVLVGGILVVALTWLGAIFVQQGQIAPGELVSFYGYAGFLVLPISLMANAIAVYTRAQVGASRILAVLALPAAIEHPADPDPAPTGRAALVDEPSGVTVAPGAIVGLVSDDPAGAGAIADRLARLDDADAGVVMWGSVPTRRIAVDELRERIVLADSEPFFFTGTLRDQLDPHARHDDAGIAAAIHAAAAEDVIDILPDGLDSRLEHRGRGLSGGQRQRLGIARAFLSDAELLVLVHPTGAVDSHTEGRIAARLRGARPDSATLVITSSPLLLAVADEVQLVHGGRVIDRGGHAELLERSDRYRDIVRREEGVA